MRADQCWEVLGTAASALPLDHNCYCSSGTASLSVVYIYLNDATALKLKNKQLKI